ncbi:MAG: phage tail sheath family protein [bacterium]
MPVQPTYPGVYVEEVPSGVRTIIGVATSITAFVGRAQRGPENRPISINSFADFERIFGGLWKESHLGFAVRDFYLNGGSRAIIVRLFHEEDENGSTNGSDSSGEETSAEGSESTEGETSSESSSTSADTPRPAKAKIKHGDFTYEAAYSGQWGNHLRLIVDHDVTLEVAERFDLTKSDLFNLTIRDTKTDFTEVFRNLTVKESPRLVNKILENESKLLRITTDPLPANIPAKHNLPKVGEDRWDDNTPATNSKVADADLASDGKALDANDFSGPGKENAKEGIYALKDADLFNILCIPPYNTSNNTDDTVWSKAAKYCEDRRAMLIIDPPDGWKTKEDAKTKFATEISTRSQNAALFFPRLKQPNPLKDGQREAFVPCGAVAGIFARTDTQRGVWKAPAGLDATLRGVPELSVPLTDLENGELNPLGINCLRFKPPAGRIVWGARTLKGDDRLASEWKYIPVRRTALFIEESLYRGTQWVVFEPNDEPLWAQIRLNVGAFMHNLFRQGAFQGSTPREAYLVKCDSETTTQNDIDQGIVNILVGFAPLKPAEFVIIKIQQLAGQIET